MCHWYCQWQCQPAVPVSASVAPPSRCGAARAGGPGGDATASGKFDESRRTTGLGPGQPNFKLFCILVKCQ